MNVRAKAPPAALVDFHRACRYLNNRQRLFESVYTTLVFLLALLVSSSSPQSVPGYSNVKIVQPQDTYSIPGTTATFYCPAQGQSDSTGNLEYLDVLVYFNDQLISKFRPPPRLFLIQEHQEVAGLLITDTELQDNNSSMYCKVEDSEGEGLISRTALLILADGKPFAVVPTQVFEGLYDIEVAWEPPLVPPSGPVLNYSAFLTGPVEQQKETEANVTSLLLEGLLPARQYSLSVVASNVYGAGNVTFVDVTTRNPVVPPAPKHVSVEVAQAHIALVSWEPVVINNVTMTPVTQYIITYFPFDNTSLLQNSTVDGSELQLMLYNLTLGDLYTFHVSAVNSAGQGLSSYQSAWVTSAVISPSLLIVMIPVVVAGLAVLMIVIIAVTLIVTFLRRK